MLKNTRSSLSARLNAIAKNGGVVRTPEGFKELDRINRQRVLRAMSDAVDPEIYGVSYDGNEFGIEMIGKGSVPTSVADAAFAAAEQVLTQLAESPIVIEV